MPAASFVGGLGRSRRARRGLGLVARWFSWRGGLLVELSQHRLTHLRQLEAESIHIIREVAAEFEKPVMLYSIGKDSPVLVRLAIKAFAPAPLPFPLMHVD